MTAQINVSRDLRGDLRAETSQDMPPSPCGASRVLIVKTYKTSSKSLCTMAEVHTRDRGFLSHSFVMFGTPLQGDYRRELARSPKGVRCTEKALTTQQREALETCGGISALIAEAEAHYIAKATHDAAQAVANGAPV